MNINEKASPHAISPADMVALSQRMAALSRIRKTAFWGLILFSIYAAKNNNWALLLIWLISAWVTSMLISYLSARKVKNLTGMSHESQYLLWKRYKEDPIFMIEATRAIREYVKENN